MSDKQREREESDFEKSRKRFLKAVELAKQKLRFAYSELGMERPKRLKSLYRKFHQPEQGEGE